MHEARSFTKEGVEKALQLVNQALSIDDNQYLTNNTLVQNPGWASAARFLREVTAPSTVRGYYQPLAMISLMVDYHRMNRADLTIAALEVSPDDASRFGILCVDEDLLVTSFIESPRYLPVCRAGTPALRPWEIISFRRKSSLKSERRKEAVR
jgi:hypothetical protein